MEKKPKYLVIDAVARGSSRSEWYEKQSRCDRGYGIRMPRLSRQILVVGVVLFEELELV
jgi:hypothetical protein